MARPTAAARGYDARWRNARLAYLSRNPLCRSCASRGRTTAAVVVDHIVPHRGDRVRFWDRLNWQALCKACHDRKTAREDGGSGAMVRPEWLPRPACRVVLVTGAPGSGKSCYCREQARPSDVVIDLDVIAAELSGQAVHQTGPDWIGPSLRERNRQLAELSKAPAASTAYVIVSAPTRYEREWWIDKLRPVEVIDLDPGEDECKRRLRTDTARSPQRMRQQLAAVSAWYESRQGLRPEPTRPGCNADGTPADPLHWWNRAQGEPASP